MYQEERTWFNQQLLYYIDSSYGSNASLDIGLTSNTGDFKSFAPPALNLAIVNDLHRKNVFINYQNSRDFIQSIGMAVQDLKSSFENKHQILKKYIKNKNLVLDFVQSTTGAKVVNISIKSGDSDFTNVYVDIPTLSAIFNLVKKFEEDYMMLSVNFQTRSLLVDLKSEMNGVKSAIHSMPSYIMDMPLPEQKIRNVTEIMPETVSTVEVLNNEFDEFLGEDMENIKLPEVPEPKKKQGITTPFLSSILGGDIANFESLITAVSQGNRPILDIIERNGSNVEEALPGIEEDDLKAILHLPKVFFNVQLKNYINGNPVSTTSPVIWYNAQNHSFENTELAFDLMMLSGYVRIMKSKLENKVSDAQENRSLMYLAVRCYTDPLVFSFINDVKPDMLKNCVLSRFESYKEKGFFKHFEKILSGYDCSEVSKSELSRYLDDVSEKVIGKHPEISEIYPKAGLKLAYKNKLNREHIINETIPLETEVKLGLNLDDDNSIAALPFKVSEDVLRTFKGENITPVKSKKVKNNQNTSNLLRFITQYRNEIPERNRDEFIEHVNALKIENYDFPDMFSLDDLGENILKAIFVWNMTDDKTEKYTDFFSKIEECSMDRKMIVTKFKSNGHDEEDIVESTQTETPGITDWISSLDI